MHRTGVFYLRLGSRLVEREASRSLASSVAPPDAATSHDRTMMDRALQLARDAGTRSEVPVGAIVYRIEQGQPIILGEGANAREADQDPAAHAEMLAIRAASKRLGSWRLDECTLVVTLEPCAMCAGLIVNARLPRVVFGAKDPKAGFAGSLANLLCDPRLNHRVTPIGGVAAEQSGEMLKRFFASLRERAKQRRPTP